MNKTARVMMVFFVMTQTAFTSVSGVMGSSTAQTDLMSERVIVRMGLCATTTFVCRIIFGVMGSNSAKMEPMKSAVHWVPR
jgi:cytochrome b